MIWYGVRMTIDPRDPHDRPSRRARPRHTPRFGGVVLVTIGAVLALIGLVDFLSSYGGSGRTPTRAWMLIAGVFLLSIGADMLKFGHLRAWATSPDPEDPPAVGSGLHKDDGVACDSCGDLQAVGASFCEACGAAISGACPSCGAMGEAGARFCDQCGADLDADAAA